MPFVDQQPPHAVDQPNRQAKDREEKDHAAVQVVPLRQGEGQRSETAHGDAQQQQCAQKAGQQQDQQEPVLPEGIAHRSAASGARGPPDGSGQADAAAATRPENRSGSAGRDAVDALAAVHSNKLLRQRLRGHAVDLDARAGGGECPDRCHTAQSVPGPASAGPGPAPAGRSGRWGLGLAARPASMAATACAAAHLPHIADGDHLADRPPGQGEGIAVDPIGEAEAEPRPATARSQVGSQSAITSQQQQEGRCAHRTARP